MIQMIMLSQYMRIGTEPCNMLHYFITSLHSDHPIFRLKDSTNYGGFLPLLQFLERMKSELTFRGFECLKKDAYQIVILS
jgi:ribonuclease BN (tRNA processing enzyme)